MRKIFILLLLVLFSLTLFSATIEVSKPFKLTDDYAYDRGPDITYGNGYYWLVYGKSYTGITNPESPWYGIDQTYGNGTASGSGNTDGASYYLYYKKATSIENLVNAPAVQFMYDGDYAIKDASNGEVWVEYYDGKIFILASEDSTDPEYGGRDVKLFWSDDDGTNWNKINDVTGDYSQHCDMEVFNNELYIYWGGQNVLHTNNPTSSTALENALANKSTFGSASSGTNRFFADKTDPNPSNHILYIAYLANSDNGNVYTYNPSTDSWSLGDPIAYSAYDPVLTKYDDNFIFLQAPWVDVQQAYLYCYETNVNDFTSDNFRMFDEACYNTNTPGLRTNNDVIWASFWGQAIVDLYGASPTGNTIVIYTSERNDDDIYTPRNGDIYAMDMNWTLGNNHYTSINTALYGAHVDNSGAASILYDPAESGDIINVICGTYKENVIIRNNHTIQGNRSAIVDPETGTSFEIEGAITVTIKEFSILDGLENTDGTVYASYNYWGSASGPEGGDITGGGDVRYIPYYTDAAMTTLAPELSVAIARNATQTTLTWSAVGTHEYTVYGCNDPDADFPGRAWTEIAGVVSGTPFTSSYQFYAVVTEDWTDGASIVGFYEYSMEPGYNYVPIALDYGYTNVTDMPTDLGISAGHTISIWDAVTQGWVSATYQGGTTWDPSGGVDIAVGDVVIVGAGVDDLSTIYLEAQIPDSWASFDLNITATTDMNLIYLPLDMADCTTLGDVAASIGSQNANTISVWDDTNQAWVTATYIEYYDAWTYSTQPVQVGQAMMVGAVQNFTWPVR